MRWSTRNVALDHYLMLTMNNNSLTQIGGPEKGQCGIRAEASSAHNHHEASLPPKQQLELELPYHWHELNATVSDVFLDEGKMKDCAQASVNAGSSSLRRSGSQLTHDVSPECEPSLLQPWKTLHRTVDNSLDVCRD